jgi:hypothetical protein
VLQNEIASQTRGLVYRLYRSSHNILTYIGRIDGSVPGERGKVVQNSSGSAGARLF